MAGSGKGPLRIAIEDFIETFHLGDLIRGGVKTWLEGIESELIDHYEELSLKTGIAAHIPISLQADTLRKQYVKHQVTIVTVLVSIGGILIGFVMGAMDPIRRVTTYKVDREVHSFRHAPADAIAVAKRRDSRNVAMRENMADIGLDDEQIEDYHQLTLQVPQPTELVRLLRKGALDQRAYEREMDKIGCESPQRAMYERLFDLIPGAGDLISMAVREAFDDDVSARFRYDENFPPEFGEWLTKQGLSADWAKRYWRAHWQLPSIGQGFEMYQRLRPGKSDVTFTKADLDLLLRIQDVAPYFRDRLTEIAYNPLTRVDVRRMYTMNVLNEAQLLDAYLDLGYSPENAQHLVDFTIRFETTEERGLTKDAIVGSYKRGLISRDDASAKLGGLAYPGDIADFYLDITDYDLAGQESDAKQDAIKAAYLVGTLDDSTVVDKLGPLNIAEGRQTALLDLWRIQRDNKTNYPSRSELDDLYRRSIISQADYGSYLKKDGYDAASIILFSKRIDMIIAEDAKLDAAAVQTEQDRLDRSKLSTTYQKNLSALNMDIAQARLAISDLKLAVYDLEDEDLIKENKRSQLQLTVFIARSNADKAQLALDFKTAQVGE